LMLSTVFRLKGFVSNTLYCILCFQKAICNILF